MTSRSLRSCRPYAARIARCAVALGLVSLAVRPCRADELDERNQSVLSYTTPQQPHYLRVALEQLAVLGAGIGQYWYDKSSNERDWQFKYDWPSFRTRIEGGAYAFDTNGYDTNFLFHPISGTLYYLSARSNHLSPLESLGVAIASSTLWEFFGEFQEKISVNDLVVTPVAGTAWGETTTQLGAFFLRACPTTSNTILGSTLAPLTALHDAADGATRVHSDCDPDSGSAHRFRFSVTGGEAWSEGLSPYRQLTAGLQTEIIHLPGFARPGTGWSEFADGNVSRFGLSASFTDIESVEVTDVALLTQTVLAGLHYRNNYYEGAELHRREAIFGVMIGAEYTRHRYDPAGAPDRIFLLDVPALTTRYYGRSADLGWELTLDAGGTWGGADTFALARAKRQTPAPDLTSVDDSEGYSHVAGVALSPRARLDLGPAEVGLDFRSDRMLAWRVLDRTGKTSSTPVSELRRRGSLWVSFGAPRLERFILSANWTQRAGSVGDVRVSRNELSLNLGVELAP